jgi:hypothetical protein
MVDDSSYIEDLEQEITDLKQAKYNLLQAVDALKRNALERYHNGYRDGWHAGYIDGLYTDKDRRWVGDKKGGD